MIEEKLNGITFITRNTNEYIMEFIKELVGLYLDDVYVCPVNQHEDNLYGLDTLYKDLLFLYNECMDNNKKIKNVNIYNNTTINNIEIISTTKYTPHKKIVILTIQIPSDLKHLFVNN